MVTLLGAAEAEAGPSPWLAVGLLVLFLVLGIASIAAWKRKVNRERELERLARAMGFSFSSGDPFDSTRVPFTLFRLGDGRQAQNVLWGAGGDGAPVRAFDFAFYDEYENGDRPASLLSTDPEPLSPPTRRYRHFSCVVAELPVVWPHLSIQPERGVTKWIGGLDVADIEFESGEFNRLFRVTCDDRRFAQVFIDAQMIELLISTRGECAFEVRGRWMLLATKQVEPKLVPGLVKLSERFRTTIPPLAHDGFTQLPTAEVL
jgi:hypothetical protein